MKKETGFGTWIPISVGVGTAIGVAMDHIGIGIAIGIMFGGLLTGIIFINRRKARG